MKGKRFDGSVWRIVVTGFLLAVMATACGGTQATPQPAIPTAEPAMPTVEPATPTAERAASTAEPEPTEITVTFEGEQCVYHGPERVPAGRIPVVLDVRDQTAHESYGVQILTMDEGHTIEEVVAYQEEISFPLWAYDHGFIKAPQGTAQERTIVLFEGPLFLSCFTNTADETQTKYVGISGPIEIEPVVPNGGAQATPAAEAKAGITVTFEGEQCVYHGPERVPAGRIPIVLDVTDQTAYTLYSVGAATVDEGKTLEDLLAYPVKANMPFWGHNHGYVEAAQGTAQETTIVLFEGPLFLVCFAEEQGKVDALGPIEIEPVLAFPKGTFVANDGNWALTFGDDGSFTFSASGKLAASGIFSIQANELTWETDSGCEGAGKATYTWTFENDTLLFQVKGKDECASRLAVLDNTSYHKEAGNIITSAEELVGIWHRTTPDSLGGEVYRQYTADGTYRMGSNPEELETQPRVEGEFWFEGEQFVMRDVAGLPGYDVCVQAGQVGRYTVERLANGHIRFVAVEDDCNDRAGMLGAGEMEPVR